MHYDPRDIWSFLLVFARVTALVGVAPAFSHRALPKPTKVGLSGIIALALLPLVGAKVKTTPPDLFSMIGQIGTEVAVGLCIGFLAELFFSAIQMAGQFVDVQMGFGIINVLNPLTQQHESAMGQLLYQLSMTVFMLMGGHLLLIGALADSFAVIGPGAAHLGGDISSSFTDAAGHMFNLAFRIAVPAASVLMVIDIAFAIISRSMPQMNVFLVGMPLKVVVGLITISIALPALSALVGDAIPDLMSSAHEITRAMR
jgi:flagellar biosynthetic protein FliR